MVNPSGGAQTANNPRVASRIEQDVETLKGFADNMETLTGRIIRHARSLGYFEPPPPGEKMAAPTPVVTTMSDAIQALGRAIDHCSGSLNVFD